MRIWVIGGPTAVLDIGGLRLVTDPTFDPPGSHPRPDGPTLTKLTPPAARPEDLGAVDAVLLSHDQHADNLDGGGRAYLKGVPLTITTRSGADRLVAAGDVAPGQVRGLAAREQTDLERPGHRGPLRVTAVPARHGPEGCEPVSGGADARREHGRPRALHRLAAFHRGRRRAHRRLRRGRPGGPARHARPR